jgi:hypothetical protein
MILRTLRILLVLAALVVAAAVGTVFLALERAPAVTRSMTPTPDDAAGARDFVRGVRESIDAVGPASGPFRSSEEQLNSVVKVAGRFIPGFRGSVTVAEAGVEGVASIPIPHVGDRKWLNLRAVAPEFEGRFALSDVEIGRFDLPPGLVLEAGRLGANTLFGNDLGDTVLTAATAMRTEGGTVAFDLAIEDIGANGVMRGVFGAMRGSDLPEAEDIDRYHRLLRTAMEAGELPSEGSYLPYLRFMLEAAHRNAGAEGIENAYTASIIALTRVCGANDFSMFGSLASNDVEAERDWTGDCSETTLNGRIDSRRHFTTAAALQAAANRGFAVSVGEFKEMVDSLKAGGFDFTDIAANNSGIRMSNKFMATPAEGWPGLMALIEDENDLIVPFEGIPQIMTEGEFEAAYGDVDSPEYFAMLDGIEARIDALTVHRATIGR